MNRIKVNKESILLWLPYLIFFSFSVIYFGFFIDYLLFYQEKASLFIFSSDFLLENLHQPGGLLIYLGKFFSTFYYYPLAGAIIISGILSITVCTISKIIYFLTCKKHTIIPFIAGVTLLYIQTDYRYLIFNSLGILMQLLLFSISIRYLKNKKEWIPVLLTPFWYFITGGFSWIYLFLYLTYLLFRKDSPYLIKIIGLLLVNLGTIYISKEFLFFQPLKTLLVYPFSVLDTGSQTIPFLSFTGLILLLPAACRIRIRLPEKIILPGQIREILVTTILSLLLLVIGLTRSDEKSKQYFHVEKLFYQNRFDEIIAYNTINKPANSLTVFLNNVALCETGKLNDMLFNFQQSPDGRTLFLKWEIVGEVLKRGGYFYYTIGMVNEAHRWAFENMVMRGHTPEGLKMLIRTDLVNGNYNVASSYINILKKTLFYKNEAKAFEKMLFNEPSLNSDPELGEKRKNILKTDFFSISDDPYINIEKILASDSLNRKAFEYKLAVLLLKKDYKGIAALLPKLQNYGFTKIPLHIEEAAITMSALKIAQVNLPDNLQINKLSEAKWEDYIAVLRKYNNNPKAAEPSLRRQFGNTFWYYVMF